MPFHSYANPLNIRGNWDPLFHSIVPILSQNCIILVFPSWFEDLFQILICALPKQTKTAINKQTHADQIQGLVVVILLMKSNQLGPYLYTIQFLSLR